MNGSDKFIAAEGPRLQLWLCTPQLRERLHFAFSGVGDGEGALPGRGGGAWKGVGINLHAVLKSELTRSHHVITGVQTFGNDRGVCVALPKLNLTPSHRVVGIDDEYIGPLLANHNALRRDDHRVLQRRENQLNVDKESRPQEGLLVRHRRAKGKRARSACDRIVDEGHLAGNLFVRRARNIRFNRQLARVKYCRTLSKSFSEMVNST